MFHNRQQLIDWLENNAPDRILANAVAQGKIELLGGFHPVPGSSCPGFIVKAQRLLSAAVYYIGIVVDEKRREVRSFRVKEPNWADWIGHKSNNSLYMGDNFDEYETLYSKATTMRKNSM